MHRLPRSAGVGKRHRASAPSASPHATGPDHSRAPDAAAAPRNTGAAAARHRWDRSPGRSPRTAVGHPRRVAAVRHPHRHRVRDRSHERVVHRHGRAPPPGHALGHHPRRVLHRQLPRRPHLRKPHLVGNHHQATAYRHGRIPGRVAPVPCPSPSGPVCGHRRGHRARCVPDHHGRLRLRHHRHPHPRRPHQRGVRMADPRDRRRAVRQHRPCRTPHRAASGQRCAPRRRIDSKRSCRARIAYFTAVVSKRSNTYPERGRRAGAGERGRLGPADGGG